MERLALYARAAPERLAGAIAAATNETVRRNPAPRDFPFFALDHPPGCGGTLLERLSELGIFRFYERVLVLSHGLGGPARWLARRRGCEVVSVDDDLVRVRASRLLVRRAYLDSAVAVVAAPFHRLPAADASFTHAWSVESLDDVLDKHAIFAELFRVVRPGGHVAIQEWVASRSPGASGDAVERYMEGLRAAGFTDPRVEEVQGLREGDSAIAEIVRRRVEEMMGEPTVAERAGFDAATARSAALGAAIAEGRLVLAQVFAQKPT